MLRTLGLPACTGALLVGMMACLGGCASAPHLSSLQLSHMGRTHVYFVKPSDNIVVVASKTDFAKAAGTTYLFGVGALLLYVGVKRGDTEDLDIETQRRQQVLHTQD